MSKKIKKPHSVKAAFTIRLLILTGVILFFLFITGFVFGIRSEYEGIESTLRITNSELISDANVEAISRFSYLTALVDRDRPNGSGFRTG